MNPITETPIKIFEVVRKNLFTIISVAITTLLMVGIAYTCHVTIVALEQIIQ